MKAGIVLMLGLLLVLVLFFAYWLRTPHRLEAQWNKLDRGLDEIDVAGEAAAR